MVRTKKKNSLKKASKNMECFFFDKQVKIWNVNLEILSV